MWNYDFVKSMHVKTLRTTSRIPTAAGSLRAMNKWAVIELLVWLFNYCAVIEHTELTKKYLPLS